MRLSLTLSFLFLTLMLSAQDLPAYQLYNAKGKKVKYAKFIKTCEDTEVVLFGELHNNPICHWLQLETTQQLFQSVGKSLVLGAEMFESDDQLLLNEYIKGWIKEKNFEEEAKLWNNYKTDYKPLVNFAKAHAIPFIGTNIPRRYANFVFRQGTEKLSELDEQALSYIAPLPMPFDADLPGYKAMLEMMGGHGGGSLNFPKAQAIKDATMAHFILKNLNEQGLFLHFNGTYHSDNFEGISWYLKEYKPEVEVVTISSVEQENIGELSEENIGKADFILVIPTSMTKTY